MKKVLACLLCLMMLSSCIMPAFAQDGEYYVPGSISHSLFADAFTKGDMLCAQVDLDFDVDVSKLDLTTEEEIALGEAVFDMLNNAVFAVSAGNTAEGFVIDLAAQYAAGEAEPVYADIRLGLSRTGLFAESILLPGERVTISWAKLLELAEVDEATSQQILDILAMDPAEMTQTAEATIAQLMEQSAALLPVITQYAQPYLDTIAAQLSALEMQVNENVVGDGYYPDVAEELVILISAKNIGDLVTALANQLEQDTVVSSVLDLLLSQSAETAGMTTAQLCASIREAAATGLTDESNPLRIFIGTDENETLRYISLNINIEGVPATLNLFNTPGETELVTDLYLDAFIVDEEGTPAGLALSVYYIDNEHPEVFDLGAGFYVYAGEETPVSVEYSQARHEMVTEEGVNGYTNNITVALAYNDGTQNVSVTAYENSESAPNSEGGESIYCESNVDSVIGDAASLTTGSSTFITAMTEEGPVGMYSEFIQAPETGVNNAMLTWDFYTKPYVTAENLTVLSLDDTFNSGDFSALEALVMRLMTNVQEPMNALSAQLPPALLDLMAGEAAPADVQPDKAGAQF